jgi:hypothetical protein
VYSALIGLRFAFGSIALKAGFFVVFSILFEIELLPTVTALELFSTLFHGIFLVSAELRRIFC